MYLLMINSQIIKLNNFKYHSRRKGNGLIKDFYNLNDFTNKSGASGLGVFVEQLYKVSDLKGIK